MELVAGLVQSGGVKNPFSLQLMAVQCVRRWLRCSAPAFHLSVVHQPHPVSAAHQPHPIPSGIGSYSPSGKGCFRRSCILRSPPRVGSAGCRRWQGAGNLPLRLPSAGLAEVWHRRDRRADDVRECWLYAGGRVFLFWRRYVGWSFCSVLYWCWVGATNVTSVQFQNSEG